MEMAPKPRHEIISEDSETYQEFKEQIRERHQSDHFVFGENILLYKEKIAALDQEIKREQSEDHLNFLNRMRANYISMRERELADLKKYLQDKFVSDIGGYLTFFTEVSQSSDFMEIFSQFAIHLQNTQQKKTDPMVVVCGLFNHNEIPQEMFERMVEARASARIEKQREFEANLPEWLADFRDAAISAVEDGWFPVSIDLLEQRMAELNVYLADSMDIPEDVGGDYDIRTNTIRIFDNEKSIQRECLFHEIIHSLGGRTIIDLHREGKEVADSLIHRRGGLSFGIKKSDKEEVDRFRWLDEAVTQEISMKLLGDPQFKAYKEERRYLQEYLYEKGVSVDTVYRAYFENYNPDDKEKVPEWKKLMRAVSQAHFNAGGAKTLLFLEKIDNLRRKIQGFKM